MICRAFEKGTRNKIAELSVDWPLLKKGDRIPIKVGEKERLYDVTDVEGFQMAGDKLVIDVWVKPWLIENMRPSSMPL